MRHRLLSTFHRTLDLLGIQGKGRQADGAGQGVKLRKPFFSADEIAVYQALGKAVGNAGFVLPRVRLIDVVELSGASSRLGEAMRMNLKSIDFLICSSRDASCLCAVQLTRGKKSSHDQYLATTVAAVGIPLFHVAAPWADHLPALSERLAALVEVRSIEAIKIDPATKSVRSPSIPVRTPRRTSP